MSQLNPVLFTTAKTYWYRKFYRLGFIQLSYRYSISVCMGGEGLPFHSSLCGVSLTPLEFHQRTQSPTIALLGLDKTVTVNGFGAPLTVDPPIIGSVGISVLEFLAANYTQHSSFPSGDNKFSGAYTQVRANPPFHSQFLSCGKFLSLCGLGSCFIWS